MDRIHQEASFVVSRKFLIDLSLFFKKMDMDLDKKM